MTMDLKTYAVFKKLTANSELLKYLMSNEPVPIHVLENDLQDLLVNLHEDDATLVVDDYQQYLQDHVKFGLKKEDKNRYEVNGEIADPVIESIELLHNINREAIVSDFITSTMQEFNGERTITIEELELRKSVDDFVGMTVNPIFGPNPSVSNSQPDGISVPTAVTQPKIDTHEQIGDVQETIQQPIYEEVSSITGDTSIPDIDLSFLDETLPDSAIGATMIDDPVFETPDTEMLDGSPYGSDGWNELGQSSQEPQEPQEPQEQHEPLEQHELEVGQESLDENPFKQAYDYVVNSIKERGIDNRLPGLHLA